MNEDNGKPAREPSCRLCYMNNHDFICEFDGMKQPNWFHRIWHYIFFGFTWEDIDNE